MKKTIALILLLSLTFLCACGEAPAPASAPTAEPAVDPTAEPTPTPVPTPETEEAEVIALEAPAIMARLDRGDNVELMGKEIKYMDYYIVKSDKGYGLMHKQFLRLENEEEYKSWTGYALADTVMYTDYTMSTVELQELEKGDKLTVLEKLDTCYVVAFGDHTGVIPIEKVQNTDKKNWDVSYGDGGNSSGGGGASSGGGWNGIPQDGTDIVISAFVSSSSPVLEKLATVIEQTDKEVIGTAEVVVTGAPLIAAFYERGDKVQVLEWGDELTKLDIFGFEAQTETRFLRDMSKAEYEQWQCFTVLGAKLYKNTDMRTSDYIPLNVNVEFTVLADMGECYLVENDSAIGYLAKDMVSTEKITASYNGGNADYSGGASSGGDSDWSAAVY